MSARIVYGSVSGLSRLMVLVVVFVVLAAPPAHASEARTVPEEVARVLRAVQASTNPAEQWAILAAYQGKPHALVALARGHAQSILGHEPEATQEYRDALRLDPSLHEAALALARQSAAHEAWAEAIQLLAAHCDPATADAPALMLYAQAALGMNDLRLATVLDQQALARFPADQGVRRLDVAVLTRSGRSAEAAVAARGALAHDPQNADLWRQLAWAEQDRGDQQAALAALEAAWLVSQEPFDRRRLADAQLGSGQPQAALVNFRVLATASLDAKSIDPPLLLAAARAAAEAGDTPQALAWLDRVPEESRTRHARLFAARIALRAGDTAAAANALEPLLAAGELDPGVLVWAGAIADKSGAWERAEALYRQAVAAAGQGTGAARLHLADLLVRHDRLDEARVVLREELSADPADTQARSMLEVLSVGGLRPPNIGLRPAPQEETGR